MVVYGRSGCSSCAEVEQWLVDASRAFGVRVERRDIENRAEWRERHRFQVPVIEIQGQERLTLRFTRAELFAALEAAAQESLS